MEGDTPPTVSTGARIQRCKTCGQPRKGHTCPVAPVLEGVGAKVVGTAKKRGLTCGPEKTAGKADKTVSKKAKKKPTGNQLEELKTLLATRQAGIKTEQHEFTHAWVQSMLDTGKELQQNETPSLETLTNASHECVLAYMEKHDDPWLKQWKSTFQQVIMKPGDGDALERLETELAVRLHVEQGEDGEEVLEHRADSGEGQGES